MHQRLGETGHTLCLSLLLGGCVATVTPAGAPVAPAQQQPADPVLLAQAGVCTGGGLCWDHPLPQGNTLRAVARPSASRIVAVGVLGTTLVFSAGTTTADGGRWSSPHNPSGRDLNALYAPASGTTWAAGAAGTLIGLDDGQASWRQAAPGTTAELRGLAGTGDRDVWAVGDGGTVLHYDGAAWTQAAVPTTADLYAVFARQSTTATTAGVQSEVFIVGSGGTVLHREGVAGAQFTVSVPGGDAADLLAVAGAAGSAGADGGSGADDVWAAGSGGLMLHYSGGVWAPVSSPATSSVTALAAVGREVWASTVRSGLWHYAGAWAQDAVPASVAYNYELRGLAGPDREHLLAVGDLGEMLAYDGQAWSELSRRQTAQELSGLWGPGDGSLWAVGDRTALRYAAGAWAAVPVPEGAGLSAVWGAAGAVYAAGAMALRYDGQQFVELPAAQGVVPLYGMWGSGAQDVWAVGRGLYHYNGTAFTQWQGVGLSGLDAIGGSGPADIWAAGQGGTVQHYDGQAWRPLATGQGQNVTLTGVFPVGPSDVWVVGTADAILHYDGKQFTPEGAEASSGASWMQVWARDAGDVWVVGRGGVVKRYYRGTWSVVPAPVVDTLEAVYGAPGGDVVLAGQNGTILRYRP